jgi:hypothetical protein
VIDAFSHILYRKLAGQFPNKTI